MTAVTDDKPTLLCLMGPTASGKTDLAIALAQELDCELVSVDSALVYRGMDIGSAKPRYPHHLVDIRDPSEAYSAAEFVADANRLCDDIVSREKTPLLVGGTMLYFKAFLEGIARMPGADPVIREAIEREAAAKGWPHLHAQLQAVDPESAARIHPNHSQRLVRALEVYRGSGTPLSEWHRRGDDEVAGRLPADRFRVVQLAICPDERAMLHERIALRLRLMMADGFLEEVKALYERGDLHTELPAIRAVGYRQLWQHLAGEVAVDEAVDHAVAATRQLAKRQLTWLRKWPDLQWIFVDRAGNVSPKGLLPENEMLVGKNPVKLALNYLASSPL